MQKIHLKSSRKDIESAIQIRVDIIDGVIAMPNPGSAATVSNVMNEIQALNCILSAGVPAGSGPGAHNDVQMFVAPRSEPASGD